jgi:glutamate/aspartate transport system ATP-binding protein
MTMMVVTHEMGFARHVASRLVFMDLGEVVEDCSTDEFFNHPQSRSDRARLFLDRILSH